MKFDAGTITGIMTMSLIMVSVIQKAWLRYATA